MKEEELDKFESFGLNKQLRDAIRELGWTVPSPVQEKAIPLIKAGKDVLGIAQTGTGKSGAFLIPLISRLHYPQGVYTRAVILVPTKELASQLLGHFESLNQFVGLRAFCAVGGIGIQPQLAALKSGNDLLIATPGRFMELYHTGEWKTKEIKVLVIDEADRMMDLGFMPQIRKILEVIPQKRQNLLFSATFPDRVEQLSAEFLEFPERVEISPSATPAETIRQLIFRIPNFQTKLNLLLFLLRGKEAESAALIFVKTKRHASEIGRFLQRKLGQEVSVLHANKGTNSRSAVVEAIQQGNRQVLVATDLASRGLDVSRIALVINVDLPIQYEDYVHRIGRTGRAMRSGTAISFIAPPDEIHLQRIEKLIRMNIEVAKLPPGVHVEETPFEEQQEMARKLDQQRKKADPDFKGAFHEKKKKNSAPKRDKKSSTGNKKRSQESTAAKGKSLRPNARKRGG